MTAVHNLEDVRAWRVEPRRNDAVRHYVTALERHYYRMVIGTRKSDGALILIDLDTSITTDQEAIAAIAAIPRGDGGERAYGYELLPEIGGAT